MPNWNDATIREFHAKAGKGIAGFGDRLLLLTTVGARVVASKGGAPDDPAWYHNLKANSVATVEVGAKTGTETFQVRAREVKGKERDRLYAERVAIAPGFGEYERQTSRKIPVMILERIG